MPWRPHAAPAHHRAGGQGTEGIGPTSLSRFEPGVERHLGEVAFIPQPAEDRANFTDDQLKHGDLLLEQRQQLIFQCTARDEVEHEDFPILADAVDAANALLDRHRVPGYIEVDERVAELNIAALAAGFGAKEHGRVVAEGGDRRVLLRPAEAAVEAGEGQSGVEEQIGQAGKRLSGMDEHQLLLGRVATKQVE